jgi:hypothetical protein
MNEYEPESVFGGLRDALGFALITLGTKTLTRYGKNHFREMVVEISSERRSA